jgi:NADPH:quinone reductase-like Zn-dependent oxidoreductase
MRAVLMTGTGGPGVLELAEVPEPEITGEHDVQVRLHAAGINPVDYKLRAGGTIGGTLPAVLGWDGADVVHDTVGGQTFTACFELVRPYGDLVSNVESRWEDAAVTALQQRNLRVSFTWMPAPSVFGWPEQRERQRRILDQAATHFDSGDLHVVVGATYLLAEAAGAHRALEAGQVTGKAVLTMS